MALQGIFYLMTMKSDILKNTHGVDSDNDSWNMRNWQQKKTRRKRVFPRMCPGWQNWLWIKFKKHEQRRSWDEWWRVSQSKKNGVESGMKQNVYLHDALTTPHVQEKTPTKDMHKGTSGGVHKKLGLNEYDQKCEWWATWQWTRKN